MKRQVVNSVKPLAKSSAIALSVLLAACTSDGTEPIDPGPTDVVASWTGGGDGVSFSDAANWDRALDGADVIRVSMAQVLVDVDAEFGAGINVSLTNATLSIGVNSLLVNRGALILDNGTITAQQGGWFQNEGSIEGLGVIRVECDDGGSSAGAVGDGVDVDMLACLDGCIDFDFNLAAGTTVSDQFAADFTVVGINNDASHPQKVVVFDSANPTGDDTDLRTPGAGAGNDTALGGLLIIPENDFDGDADGLIDNPDDESAGGAMVFNLSCAYIVEGLSMIDIEEFGGAHVELFNGGTSVYVANGAQLDDNSVQGLDFTNAPPADQIVVTMSGSGAIDNLRICPTHE